MSYMSQEYMDSLFGNPTSNSNEVVANLNQMMQSRGYTNRRYNSNDIQADFDYEFQRQNIVKALLTPEGRASVASAMQEALRMYADYTGVGRVAFNNYTVGQGVEPYFDFDADVTAYVVGEEEGDPIKVVRTRRVQVMLKEIASLLMIPLTELRKSRYDLQQRVKEKVQSEIMRVEDVLIFSMLKTIAERGLSSNDKIVVKRSEFNNLSPISRAISEITKHGDLKAQYVFTNPYNAMVLRDLPQNYFLDFETSKQLIELGYIGKVFGCDIRSTSVLPIDTIFVTADPKFFGTFVVAQDLTVLNADEPKDRKIGFSVFEQIGMFVHNANGLVMIQITND